MNNSPSDQGIPILTEVISSDAAEPSAPVARPEPLVSQHAAVNAPPAATSVAEATIPPFLTASPRMSVPLPSATPTPAAPAMHVQPPTYSSPLHPGIAPAMPATPSAPAASAPAPPLVAHTSVAPTITSIPSSLLVQTPAPTPLPPDIVPAMPAALSSLAASAPVAQVSAPGAPAASLSSDGEWHELENELRQSITRQVLGRIDFVLDHRVRNSLTDVVDAAIDGLAAEIKRGLHETLEDMVARAVAQEISRIQLLKK